mmetsp:Transcript_15622/g.34138  ORF Transcript_15622/g.34138 Transcript_15622/m.34138 type:complete len:465 (+) Transcript_15622:102-1496(+)
MTRSNQQRQCYDINVNPPYQVNWSEEQSGKKIAKTKRRVKFNFGFSNREALENGHTGNEARGEEHSVDLVWSITSGKRLVLADGDEIHFSKGSVTDNKFETSWTIGGGHIVKLTAHAAPPLFPTPGFKQYDLTIDGLSYFSFPKIYELGMKTKLTQTLHSAEAESFALPPQYRNEVSQVRTVSETRVPPPAAPSFAMPPAEYHQASVVSAPAVAPVMSPVAAVPPQEQSWNQTPTPQTQANFQNPFDEFAPVPPSPHEVIMNAYTPVKQAKVPALANAPHYADYNNTPSTAATVTDVSDYEETPEKEDGPSVLKPTMAPLAISEMEEQESSEFVQDGLTKAFKSLVNLDDLTVEVEAPEQAKMNRLVQSKKENSGASKPLAPSVHSWKVGPNASLSEIKDQAPAKDAPSKDIMRTHAFDPRAAQAGMMVVYGATPPMIQQPHHGGFAHHAHAAIPPPPVYYRAY